ncbi:MAG: hypothetical protein RBR66_02660 [Candidatus Izemoplasmatales bacterium]|jgi:ribosome maturation factor RimP|nr:hypothetical protein [Candidatus Izemoplasmatales bacterium]
MDLSKLKEQLKEFLKETKFELYDVEFVDKKTGSILTVYVDGVNDLSIDDIVEATRLIDPFIDKLDPIDKEYYLEVSSPGAEKELRSKEAIKRAVDKYVYLETYEQKLEGKLITFDGEFLTIVNNKNKKIKIDYIDVNLIRLAIKF